MKTTILLTHSDNEAQKFAKACTKESLNTKTRWCQDSREVHHSIVTRSQLLERDSFINNHYVGNIIGRRLWNGIDQTIQILFVACCRIAHFRLQLRNLSKYHLAGSRFSRSEFLPKISRTSCPCCLQFQLPPSLPRADLSCLDSMQVHEN